MCPQWCPGGVAIPGSATVSATTTQLRAAQHGVYCWLADLPYHTHTHTQRNRKAAGSNPRAD
ncbi:hypothetical protein J4Q44_G00015520 [Coregonus suidteri]|uniref:Uncharacterized protein n=1 Tax=Coregonus suidteri TaxID=861788 RepID=A0AAN8MEC2_9TELE